MPHDDAHVLTLEVEKHLMKRILINPSNAVDLLYLFALLHLGYKPTIFAIKGGCVSRLQRIVDQFIGGNSIASFSRTGHRLVPLKVIDEPSSFNAILGGTWIHAMKALSSSYHQMLSFRTPMGQVDVREDQKAVVTCYEVKQHKDDAPTK